MRKLRLDLNGTWQFIHDPEDVGWKERWFTEPPQGKEIHDVPVPGIWQEVLPGVHGVGWYFLTWLVPDDYRGKRAELVFDAVDYYAQVWLNGDALGAHEGGYTPFRLDATKALRHGEHNLLTVRVVDPHVQGTPIAGFDPEDLPTAKEGGYEPFGGIWGGVRLETTGNPWIHNVFAIPHLDKREFEIRSQLRHTFTESMPVTLLHEVLYGNATESSSPLVTSAQEGVIEPKGGNRLLHTRLAFPDAELWSLDAPVFYTLRTHILYEDRPVAQIENRIGMREFSFDGRFFRLNGQPVILRSVLQQPDYPIRLPAPMDEEMARRELMVAKEAGFNTIRLHIKTAPEITIRLAEEIGLLLYEEPPIGWIRKSDKLRDRCMREVQDMVIRDRNSPAVVMWGMLNETGNAQYILHGGAQDIREELALETRRLDPSRPVLDDSGGSNCHKERTKVLMPFSKDWHEIDDLHIYQRGPADRVILENYRVSGSPGLALMVSEFGFGGMETLPEILELYAEHGDTPWQDREKVQSILDAVLPGYNRRGLHECIGDFADFCRTAQQLQAETARRHVEALRSNPKLAGYCYTQLSDADHEFAAGVMDRWRRKKPVATSLARAHEPTIVIVDVDVGAVEAGQSVSVTVRLVHDGDVRTRDVEIGLAIPTAPSKQGATLSWVSSIRERVMSWPGVVLPAPNHAGAVNLIGTVRDVDAAPDAPPLVSTRELLVLPPVHTEILRARYVSGSGFRTADLPVDFMPQGDSDDPWVVPPLADSGLAYPLESLGEALLEAYHGDTMVVVQPPPDLSEVLVELGAAILGSKRDSRKALAFENKDAVGAFLGVYHYIRDHPLFEGLPKTKIMREAYKNVIPSETFEGFSEEDDPCGTFDTKPVAVASQQYMFSGKAEWWGSDCLVRPFGRGWVILTHLRLFEHLTEDVLVRRMLANTISWARSKKAETRSDVVPAERAALQEATKKLSRRAARQLESWWFLGPFRNDCDGGLDTVYPPERGVDLRASCSGALGPVRWKPIHARAASDYLIDLQDASMPPYCYYPRFDSWVGYLYRELDIKKAGDYTLAFDHQDGAKLWLDGDLIHRDGSRATLDSLNQHRIPVSLTRGSHGILAKIEKVPGQWRARLSVEPAKEV